jgi:hypothetical protein
MTRGEGACHGLICLVHYLQRFHLKKIINTVTKIFIVIFSLVIILVVIHIVLLHIESRKIVPHGILSEVNGNANHYIHHYEAQKIMEISKQFLSE